MGPPAAGEIIMLVDPRKSSGPFAMGTYALQPGAGLPVHRHLREDEVWFFHKGQGRAEVEGRAITVVPGSTVYLPRQSWHGLRNTGTGLLQFLWVASPPGIEEFFRELSRVSGSPDLGRLQDLAGRYGIELQPASSQAPSRSPQGGRRRHRHRGRGAARPRPQSPPLSASPPHVSSPPPAQPSQTTARSRQGPRRAGRPAPEPQRRSTERHRGRRYGHVKEVYMGGRWVRVSGEGPIIAGEKAPPTERKGSG